MPTRNKFNPQTISEPKKHQFVVDAFRGVDYRPIEMQVANYNAVEIENFIFRDNANQKRMGYEQLLNIPIQSYVDLEDNQSKTNTSNNVNGLWTFIDENGNKRFIAHIGSLLYEISGIDGAFYKMTYKLIKDTNNKTMTLLDRPSGTYSAFSDKGKLFILSGNYYYALYSGEKASSDFGIQCSDLVFIKVADSSISYIPTTTIGITYKDSPVKSNTSLDKVNLLSKFRKNKLVSGTFMDDGETTRTTEFYDYELDSEVWYENETDLNNLEVDITEYLLNEGE